MYVIKDENGNYVSPRENRKKWYFVLFSGITSGFTFYSNVDTAKKEMGKLNSLGHGFSLEYVEFKSIPNGKCII